MATDSPSTIAGMSASTERSVESTDGTTDSPVMSESSSSLSSFRPRSSTRQPSDGSLSESFSSLSSFRPRSSTRQPRKSIEELTINKLRFEALGLYGRDEQTQLLKESFQILNKNRRVLVLISGYSGTGKTALAKVLQEPVQQAKGFYIYGKFEQQTDEPYAGVTAACRQLCEQLACLDENNVKSAATTKDIRSTIRNELGAEARVLMRLIPNLKHLLAEKDIDTTADTGVHYTEARNQFNFAFRILFRVVASFGPVILVLDDLQWADSASLDLLEVLITDDDNPSLMVIGCYRSNEIDEAHLASKTIKHIQECSDTDQIVIHNISIGDFEIEHVNQLLADLLSSDTTKTQRLAEIIHRKTNGNIFFVIQFLTSLQSVGLLEFSIGALAWQWDIQTIEMRTSATENVVDLIQAKLNSLPPRVIQIAQLAACLGTEFREVLLCRVADSFDMKATTTLDFFPCLKEATDDSTESLTPLRSLLVCVDEGLIEESGINSYRWVHDKIQEAAILLVPPSKLNALQFRVGEILVDEQNSTELTTTSLFVTVNLLNKGAYSIPDSDPKRLELTNLNLLAGKKAIELSAFLPAIEYLAKGIELLPEDCWKNHYKLSLDLFSAIAEAEYCVGDTEGTEYHCNEVLAQANHSLEDKFRAYNTLIFSTGNNGRTSDAIDLCLRVLSQLGCTFPKRGILLFTVAGLIKTKATLKNTTTERISKLPTMTDKTNIEIMRVLDNLGTYSYIGKPELLPLVILKSLKWTMLHGICEHTPPAFAFVGLILTSMNDIQGGRIYGRHALFVLEKVQSKATESRTLFLTNALVLHWTMPAQQTLKPLIRGYEVGMRRGDVESAMWCIYCYLELARTTGRPLESIEADCRTYAKQMKDFNQLRAYETCLVLWQAVMNLTGGSDHTTTLTGEAMDQDKELKRVNDTEFSMILAKIHHNQMYLACFFGEHELGVNLALKHREKVNEQNPGGPSVYVGAFVSALSFFSMARKTRKTKYKKEAMNLFRTIRDWRQKGNPNVLHYESLLDAEAAALQGKKQDATKKYKDAVLKATRVGMTQDQALANERFGDFLLEVDERSEAAYHFSLAIQLYKEWGAGRKVSQLERRLETDSTRSSIG